MRITADLECERSLEATWHAYGASVGDPNQVKSVTGQEQRVLLADPQQMNSYNYGRDNPITNEALPQTDEVYGRLPKILVDSA
jgi:hypothetical protein